MPRDRETHKAKGFSFLMYEDQRSTVLAVDNMNGGKVLGRTVRVDHVRSYKHPDKTNAEGERVEAEEPTYNAMPPLIGGEGELGKLSAMVVASADQPGCLLVDDDSDDSSDSDARNSADDEDPMAAYIRAQKREEKKARKEKKGKGKEKDEKKKRKHEGETKEERAARKREKKEKKEGKKHGAVLKLEDRVRDRSEGRRSIKRESEEKGSSSSRHRDDYSRDRERRYRDASPPRRGSPSIGRRGSPDVKVKAEPDMDWRSARQETQGGHNARDSARDRDVERDRSYRQRDADRTMRQMDRSRDEGVRGDRRYDRDRRPDERDRAYDRGERFEGRPPHRD